MADQASGEKLVKSRPRAFADPAGLTQRGCELLKSKNQIYFAPHESFLSQGRHSADRNRAMMKDEAKLQAPGALELFSARRWPRQRFPRRSRHPPVGQDTVAQILIHLALVRFDDFLAGG